MIKRVILVDELPTLTIFCADLRNQNEIIVRGLERHWCDARNVPGEDPVFVCNGEIDVVW